MVGRGTRGDRLKQAWPLHSYGSPRVREAGAVRVWGLRTTVVVHAPQKKETHAGGGPRYHVGRGEPRREPPEKPVRRPYALPAAAPGETVEGVVGPVLTLHSEPGVG